MQQKKMAHHTLRCLKLIAVSITMLSIGSPVFAQSGLAEPDSPQTDWETERDNDTSHIVMTKRLTLHPAAEPQPALQHRFIPDPFDLKSGNAAIYYLKAMGFFEQSAARKKLFEYQDNQVAEAKEKDLGYREMPPYNWLEIAPDQLPLKKVKDYLQYTSFQPQFLVEAQKLRTFSLDRNIRDVKSPISYLLPEIQAMREMARMQSLRCRVAIAENRVEDVIASLGQQFALAHHLGDDEFLVSNLVGAAVAGIAWTDLLYTLEMPDAPNLYWAMATVPRPLISMEGSMSYERQLVYEQLKGLRVVDRTQRTAGYWQDFIVEIYPQLIELGAMMDNVTPDIANTPANRARVISTVAAAYPGARDYLINELEYPLDQVDDYPTAQVVFLAMREFYDRTRDEIFKLHYLPYTEAKEQKLFAKANDKMRKQAEQIGWASLPTTLSLGWMGAATASQQRVEMQFALGRTIESIRNHASVNQNQLPGTLEELTLPAPVNPTTGQPFDYIKTGETATLSGGTERITYKLILEIK